MSRGRWVAAIAAVALSAAGLTTAVTGAAVAAQPSVNPSAPGMMPSAVPSTKTPAVNDGDVRSIARVGSTMVISGNFTTVASVPRSRVAAFDPSTGTLTSFAPVVNGEVTSVLPGVDDQSVYVGGSFTQINGAPAQYVALLDLNTGQVRSSFSPPAFNFGGVSDMVKRGNRLYLAGFFTKVGGKNHGGLASLNATTGALDPFVNVQVAGRHNDTGSGAQGWIGPWAFDVTPDGKQMVATGNFKTVDGLLRDQLVTIDLTGTSAAVRTDWATSRYSPYCFNWAFDGYTRGVSYSPDGSYFVVNATGGGVAGTLCDATTRFERNGSGTDVQPTWVNEAGGDTMWGLAITDTAVFVGGHARWNNNPTGSDYAGPGAVPRPGLAALDPVSGRPLQWNPGRNPPGKAVYAMLATADGLYVGSDTDWVGNRKYKRQKIAMFPYQGGYTVAATGTGSLPGTVFLGGAKSTGATNVLYRVNAGGASIQSLDSGPDWMDDSGTNTYRNDGSNPAGWGPVPNVDSTVPATAPRAIFDSERWSPSDNPSMKWAFPVTAGTPLEVRLYFANRCTCTSAVGSRKFDVALDGTKVLDNFDIVGAVGDQTGTMRSYTIVSDGSVNIDFAHRVENPLINGIEIVRTDRPAPPPADVDGLTKVAFTGSSAGAPESLNNGGVAWGQSRGAFMVGNKVFYGMTDGFLYSRTFNGSTWGSAVQINPYHDPAWKDVDNNLGGTYDGNSPTLYSQMPNVTGMFYASGRLYYTLFGDSALRSRWFSPDSGIVDETNVTAPSSVNFSTAGGMFAVGDTLYVADRNDGTLSKVSFSGGVVSGTPVRVSGPQLDGVDWRSRSMFLYVGPALNIAPTASFTAPCTNTTCTVNGSGSTDPDGAVASYAWEFGDGAIATGVTAMHTYGAAGNYTVKLTVTDDKGATGSATQQLTVTAPPPNQPPTAAFTTNCSAATCAFDGSGSSDPEDGVPATFAWTFGDGATAAGAQSSHTYVASGTYSVTLEVTDAAGATDSATHDVTVTAPQSPITFIGAGHSAPLAQKVKQVTVPAGTQAGDTLLMVFTKNTTSTWSAAPAGITGWTKVDDYTWGSIATTVWSKTATGSDLGQTVRFDNTTTQKAVMNLMVYRGADAASIVTSNAGDVSTAQHTTPQLTVGAGVWGVSYWADKSSTTESWAAPAAVTLRDTAVDTSGTGRFTSLVADSGGPVTAGSYGGLVATVNAPSDRATMLTIVLSPTQ